MLLVLFFFFMTGCYGGERDENHILRGESSSWRANLEVVFSTKQDMYYIGGNLRYKPDSIPKEVNYYISHPYGKSSGGSRGEKIRIPQGGSTLHRSSDDIEAFAEQITLRVEWESEDGESFSERVPLD